MALRELVLGTFNRGREIGVSAIVENLTAAPIDVRAKFKLDQPCGGSDVTDLAEVSGTIEPGLTITFAATRGCESMPLGERRINCLVTSPDGSVIYDDVDGVYTIVEPASM